MQKVILITGSTDGIGLEAAKLMAKEGHRILLHGRSKAKVQKATDLLSSLGEEANIESYVADLSLPAQVEGLAAAIKDKHTKLDVIINIAGVYRTPDTLTADGLDVRFVVNSLAPVILTQSLLPLMQADGRVVNLSSAAQAPVNIDALLGRVKLADIEAYSQSKLAITMWSRHMALTSGEVSPVFVALNPGSLLATKMVKEGFGVAGSDIGIGATIIKQAALGEEFASVSGLYYDNDSGQFAAPHRDALDEAKCQKVVEAIASLIAK